MPSPRRPLQVDSELILSNTAYTITGVLGGGSNALCYRAEYEDDNISGRRHSVLIKELFPLHERGLVWRGDGGTLYVEPGAEDFFALHRRSFLRGCAVGMDLNDARPDKSMPVLNTHEANGTLYAVLGVSGGAALECEEVKTLQSAAEITVGILHALRPFHAAGLWHLDISPDNILFMPRDKGESIPRLLLIDYNSVFSSGEILDESQAYFSIKNPFTAPEVRLKDYASIGAATDLYSVAAVFARLICRDFSGSLQQIHPALPIFDGVPQTAVHKAIGIIRRGLRLSAGNRYQSIDELLADLRELLDRIGCAGVTRPALWEASASQYKSMVAENPRFSYISGGAIPSQIAAGDIYGNTLLTGGGGMGKTTAMLRIWQSGVKRYNPGTRVPLYIKLNDYSAERSIRVRCLNRLHFTAGTSTVADALKALDNIFNEKDSVLLLLDGYNEVADSQREAMLSEIAELSEREGVRIIVSSRAGVEELAGFHRMQLSPLAPAFVQAYLNANGLLYPGSETLQKLLTNPMMLTMYAAFVGDTNEYRDSLDEATLIKAYLDHAASKANSRRAAQFAVEVFLPCVAAAMAKHNTQTLSGPQLLACLGRLYRALKGRRFYREFPEYIGDSPALLSGAENAEEWFGVIVAKLLGQELALLVKTESGGYCFAHQLFRDYFTNTGREVGKRLRRTKKRLAVPLACLGFVVLALGVTAVLWLQSAVSYYDDEEAFVQGGETGPLYGNMNYGGYAVAQGDWIYFATDDGLWKVKEDGRFVTRLGKENEDKNPRCLNVQGDWIYYACRDEKFDSDRFRFLRIRTDGSDYISTFVNAAYSNLGEMVVYENNLYYTTDSEIIKIPTAQYISGTEDEVVAEAWYPRNLIILEAGIHYLCAPSEDAIDMAYESISIDDGPWRYTLEHAGPNAELWGYAPGTGLEDPTLLGRVEGSPEIWNVAGNYFYWIDDTQNLRQCRFGETGGFNDERILASRTARDIFLAGGWVFYHGTGADEQNLFMIKTDGTGEAQANPA